MSRAVRWALGDGLPPIWEESRTGFELAALLRHPVWRGAGAPRGERRPVLLVPGFMMGDAALVPMRSWLQRAGFDASTCGMRMNVGCASVAVERLEDQLERLAERSSQRVTIVGHSRGGHFARALAVRRPELVEGIVTLGTPRHDPKAVHPLMLVPAGLIAALGSLGVPGLISHSCHAGACCRDFRSALDAPFPSDVRYLAIYSERDGIVRWRTCGDPYARRLRVAGSHCGMVANVEVYRALADELRAPPQLRALTPPPTAVRLTA